MVRIGAADDHLHRCLLSKETESAADCVLTTEDRPGRCELLGAAGTRTARVRSAFCGITELAFWRDVLKLAFASKRDLKERAMQDELIRRKPGPEDDLGTSQHDRGAEDTLRPMRDWWHPKPKPHRVPLVASVSGGEWDSEAGGTRCCVGLASSAASPATKAPSRSASLHGRIKASREEPSPSPPPAVNSRSLVGGALQNKPILALSVTSFHLAGVLVMFFGCTVVLRLVLLSVQCRRRSERERQAGGLQSSSDEASSEPPSRSCVIVSQ